MNKVLKGSRGLLKEKLRHIKSCLSLFEQKSIRVRQHQMEVVRSALLTGAQGANFSEKTWKQSKEII